MKEIVLEFDDGTQKKIQMKSVCGRHALKIWKAMEHLTSENAGKEVPEVLKYRQLLIDIAAELTGLSSEQIDELPVEQKVKITGIIEEKTREEMGFTKPS